MKVPKREIRFLVDQRKERRMIIEGVDKEVTEKWDRADSRKEAEASNLHK